MSADPMKDATGLFLDRRIRTAERIADHLVAMLRGMLTEFGLDPADPAVVAVVRKHLAGQGQAGHGSSQ